MWLWLAIVWVVKGNSYDDGRVSLYDSLCISMLGSCYETVVWKERQRGRERVRERGRECVYVYVCVCVVALLFSEPCHDSVHGLPATSSYTLLSVPLLGVACMTPYTV